MNVYLQCATFNGTVQAVGIFPVATKTISCSNGSLPHLSTVSN